MNAEDFKTYINFAKNSPSHTDQNPVTYKCNIIRRLCYGSDKASAEEAFKIPALYAIFIELYDDLIPEIINNKRSEGDSRQAKKVVDVAKEMEQLKIRA